MGLISVGPIAGPRVLSDTDPDVQPSERISCMNVAHTTTRKALSICHYLPGGTESGGGIGRLVGYIKFADGQADHRVIDTRGARFSPAASALRLAHALCAMAVSRVTAPQTVHHIHVAGRGSTRRKLILTAWARALGCTHLLHLHDYDYATDLAARSPRQLRAIRRMFAGADGVLVLGQRDRRTVFNLLGHATDKVTVLHNAVPDPGPAVAVPQTGAAPVRLLFLGQLGPRKGVPELLRALADPALAALPWQTVLAGDGPVETYRAEAAALGLSDRVTLTGWLNAAQVDALCRRSDILVLPSHGEGMAMAVLEGLAHGLAVVTTPVGAHGEVLTDGITGVFVPVGDVTALAATLARLIADGTERAALSRAGRAHYLQYFSIAAYTAHLDQIYRATAEQACTTRDMQRGAA